MTSKLFEFHEDFMIEKKNMFKTTVFISICFYHLFSLYLSESKVYQPFNKLV